MQNNNYKRYKKQEVYDNIFDETEVIEWNDLEGSFLNYQINQHNVFLKTNVMIKSTVGSISGKSIKHEPYFNISSYTTESNRITIALPISMCATIASAFDAVTQPSSINEYFSKSQTSGWVPKAKYSGSIIFRKDLRKSTSIEIIPVHDVNRRVPSYKINWTNSGKSCDTIISRDELKLLSSMLYQFIGNAPIYVSMAKQTEYFKNIQDKFDKYDSLFTAFGELANSNNKLAKSVHDFEENISKGIKDTVSVSMGMMMATMTELIKNNNVPVVDKDTYKIDYTYAIKPEPEELEDDGDEIILNEDRTLNDSITDNIMNVEVETYVDACEEEDVKKFEELKTDSFNDVVDILPEEYNILEPLNTSIEDVEKIVTSEITDPIIPKTLLEGISYHDDLVRRIEKETGVVIEDVVEYENDFKNGMLKVYPRCITNILTKELSDHVTKPSMLPDNIRRAENIGKDVYESKLSQKENKDDICMIENMLETKMYGRWNLGGLIFNKGMIGIPASSVIMAMSIMAGCRELQHKGEKTFNIGLVCGRDIMDTHINNTSNIEPERLKIYRRYHKIITDQLGLDPIPEDSYMFINRSIVAVDKMLTKGNFEFCQVDFKLDNCTDEERNNIIMSIVELYFISLYSKKEDMDMCSVTPSMTKLYEVVNVFVTNFLRTLLVNYSADGRRDKKESADIGSNILGKLNYMNKFVKKMGWSEHVFKDSVVSFTSAWLYSYDLYTKTKDKIYDKTVNNSYITDTTIYRGLPCEEIFQILLNSK